MPRSHRRPAALLALALLSAGAADAQSFGKPTPGVCFLSKQRVLDRSTAGAAANQRMEALRQAVIQELSGERAAIAQDSSALQADKPIVSQATYQQRAGALALRQEAFENLQNMRNGQLARTRALVTGLLIRQMAPLLAQILSQRGCSAVFESSDAYAFTPTMDLTEDVIRAMDAHLGPITFDLQPPDQQ
jgi:Skp family chaperone for outer membrane proteins